MKQFPNKTVVKTYDSAKGKTFTWSPTYQRFTDETGCSDYDYHSMMWLKDNEWLVELRWSDSPMVQKFLMRVIEIGDRKSHGTH